MPRIFQKDQKFTVYVPVEKGLSMTNLVNVCKDKELEGTSASSLHPIQRCDIALAVKRPEVCPVTTQDVWKFKIDSLYNLGVHWPCIMDEWREQVFDEVFLIPIKKEDDKSSQEGRKRYRRLQYSDEEAKRMRSIQMKKWKYEKNGISKRKGYWAIKFFLYPDDCPKDVVENVKGAFRRAGYLVK
jgi:hypothetical protein